MAPATRRTDPFPLAVRPGLVLDVSDTDMAEEYHAVVERNLARLALWEPWAGTPQSLSGIRTYLAWQSQAYRTGAQVPLVMRLDGAVAGSCTARIDRADGVAEIGYWIDAAQEGRGVASAAVGAVTSYLFERGDIARVQARTAVHNARSRAMLERLGFELEGVLRRSQAINGGRVDMAMYARVAA